jgi:large subunit ribosomal protein L17
MRHQRTGRKLGRDASHRKALYANLAGALIEHGRIKTTVTKAKAVKPIAERMITLGRRGDLHARRQAVAFLRSKDVVHKLFTDVAPRLADRPGGYARIVKIGPRPGDAAEMAYLELIDEPVAPTERPSRRGRREQAAVPAQPEAAEEEELAEESLEPEPEEPVDEAEEELLEEEEEEEGPTEPTGEAEEENRQNRENRQ